MQQFKVPKIQETHNQLWSNTEKRNSQFSNSKHSVMHHWIAGNTRRNRNSRLKPEALSASNLENGFLSIWPRVLNTDFNLMQTASETNRSSVTSDLIPRREVRNTASQNIRRSFSEYPALSCNTSRRIKLKPSGASNLESGSSNLACWGIWMSWFYLVCKSMHPTLWNEIVIDFPLFFSSLSECSHRGWIPHVER